MRLWEIVLLAANLAVLAMLLFGGRSSRARQAALLAGGATEVVLAIHLIIEGYRWQLFGVYLISIILVVISFARMRKRVDDVQIRTWIKVTLGGLGTIILLLSGSLVFLMPVFELPRPTGTYPVGTRTWHTIDTSRNDPFAERQDTRRELMLQVWYPAEPAGGEEKSGYIPSGREELKALAAGMKMPVVLIDYLKYVRTHAYRDAPISDKAASYPLIILNHGFGTTKVIHNQQAENLASHGYIVVSIDHTYGTQATLFPDGRVAYFGIDEDRFVDSNEYRSEVVQLWASDIVFVIDEMERMNEGTVPSGLEGTMDLSQIGVFGHSFGGAASYLASFDTRIKAGIDMDGTLVGFEPDNPLAKPFLFLYPDNAYAYLNSTRKNVSYTDQELMEMGTTRDEFEQFIGLARQEVSHIQHVLEHQGEIISIEGADHYNLTDVPLISPLIQQLGMTGTIDGKRSAAIVNEIIVDFFDRNLGGTKTNDDILQAYPEVHDRKSEFIEETP